MNRDKPRNVRQSITPKSEILTDTCVNGLYAGITKTAFRNGNCRPIKGDPSPDCEYTGVGEHGIGRKVDKVVQFERFGFGRIGGAGEEELWGFYAQVKL